TRLLLPPIETYQGSQNLSQDLVVFCELRPEWRRRVWIQGIDTPGLKAGQVQESVNPMNGCFVCDIGGWAFTPDGHREHVAHSELHLKQLCSVLVLNLAVAR